MASIWSIQYSSTTRSMMTRSSSRIRGGAEFLLLALIDSLGLLHDQIYQPVRSRSLAAPRR